MEKEIVIYPDYTLKDFLKHTFRAVFKRKFFSFIAVLFGVMALVVDFLYAFNLVNRDEWFPNGLPVSNIVIPLVVFVLVPLVLFLTVRKHFLSNYRLKENYAFTFNKKYFKEKGDSFDVDHYWDKLYRVKECKNWFEIFHSKSKSSYIPKRFFTREQLMDFRNLIKEIGIRFD